MGQWEQRCSNDVPSARAAEKETLILFRSEERIHYVMTGQEGEPGEPRITANTGRFIPLAWEPESPAESSSTCNHAERPPRVPRKNDKSYPENHGRKGLLSYEYKEEKCIKYDRQ